MLRLATLKRIAGNAVKFARLLGAVHLVQRDNFCHVTLCLWVPLTVGLSASYLRVIWYRYPSI